MANPASTKPTVSLDDARTWALQRLGTAEDIEALDGGWWSSAFVVRRNSERLVVRFSSDPNAFVNDEVAATWGLEHAAVPNMLLREPWTQDDTVGEVAVTRFVAGEGLDSLNATGWIESFARIVEALVELASLPAPGAAFGRWHPGQEQGQEPTWHAWLAAAGDRPVEAKIGDGWNRLDANRSARLGALLDRYEDALPTLHSLGVPRRLAHGDLTAGNLLVRGGRVVAVFDWANSVAGDPLYDVANLTFWQPFHPGSLHLGLRSAFERRYGEAGVPPEEFRQRLWLCEQHIALDALQFNAWLGRLTTFDHVCAAAEEIVPPT